jgi:hypothetical protein
VQRRTGNVWLVTMASEVSRQRSIDAIADGVFLCR